MSVVTQMVPIAAIEQLVGLSVAVAHERYDLLTPRECDVALRIARGKPNRRIAEELGICPVTLDMHRANLMHKLEVRTVANVANLVNLVLLTHSAE